MDTIAILEGLIKEDTWGGGDVDNPKWEKTGMVHDWRNHVPDGIVEIWEQLSRETRLLAYYMAELQAKREQWD